MPGGQWSRDDKYIAEDMRKSFYAPRGISKNSLAGFKSGQF